MFLEILVLVLQPDCVVTSPAVLGEHSGLVGSCSSSTAAPLLGALVLFGFDQIGTGDRR